MKRRLCGVALALVMLTALAACGGSGGGGSQKPAELDLTPSADLSSDIYDFQIQVDSEVFTLPYPLEQLMNNGWEVEIELDEEMPPMTYTTMLVKKWGLTKGVTVLNNSQTETITLADTVVGGFEASAEDAEAGLAVVLPGGFTFGASYEEILAAYGEPESASYVDSVNREGPVSYLSYAGELNEYNESCRWEFFFDEENGGMTEVRVKKWV